METTTTALETIKDDVTSKLVKLNVEGNPVSFDFDTGDMKNFEEIWDSVDNIFTFNYETEADLVDENSTEEEKAEIKQMLEVRKTINDLSFFLQPSMKEKANELFDIMKSKNFSISTSPEVKAIVDKLAKSERSFHPVSSIIEGRKLFEDDRTKIGLQLKAIYFAFISLNDIEDQNNFLAISYLTTQVRRCKHILFMLSDRSALLKKKLETLLDFFFK